MKPMNNILIDRPNNEVRIRLNTIFYPQENVLATVDIFKSFFSVEIAEQTEDSILICLKPKSETEDYIEIAGLEFVNHLLEEIKCNDVL